MTTTEMTLPEPHRQHVAEVMTTISNLRPRWNPENQFNPLAATAPTDSHAVVAICGDRGAGKSTVLHEVCQQLRQTTDLVLPTICPEFFSSADSVLGLALANLHQTLLRSPQDVLNESTNEDEPTISTVLSRLLRRASIVGARETEDRGHSYQPLEIIADDFVRSVDVSSTFTDQWRHLTKRVLDATTDSSGLLFIPIDDADLVPELLPRILVDLRIMTSATRVVCLVCVDLDEARHGLAEHYLQEHAHLTTNAPQSVAFNDRLYGVVESQLSKAIPPQWRVPIRDLTLTERLQFSPLGASPAQTLLSLLETFTLPPGGAPQAALSNMFQLATHDRRPSPYAHCLSSNPRDLATLHFQLRQAGNCPDPIEASRVAARHLVEHGLHYGLRRSPRAPVNTSDLISFDTTTGVDIARINTEDMRITLTVPSDSVAIPVTAIEPGSEVQVQALAQSDAFYASDSKDRKHTSRLHRAAFNSLLLVKEFSYAYRLLEEARAGHTPVKGGFQGSVAVTVTLGKYRTDRKFLMHPAWEGYYDYFLIEESWRSVIGLLRKENNWGDHRDALAAVTLEWWRLHAHVQSSRTSPKALGNIIKSTCRATRAERSLLLEETFDEVWTELCDVYVRELDRNEVRATDYTDWVETYLLFVCHPALHHTWFIERLISARQDLLARPNRLSVGDAQFVAAMTSRLRRVTEEPWITPLIDLTKRFDEPAGLEIERLHLAAAGERQRGLARLLGAQSLPVASVEQHPDTNLYKTALAALRDLELGANE